MSRRRWLYTQGGKPLPEPVEVTSDYVDTSSERMPLFTDRYLEGARATDGTDVGSRRKRREYMLRNDVTDASDYRQFHADRPKREAVERQRELRSLTEQVGRTAYQLTHRRRK